MKSLQKNTLTAFNGMEDILENLLGATGKKIFLGGLNFPKYLRLPYSPRRREEVLGWIKKTDGSASEEPEIPFAVKVNAEIPWGSHLRFFLGDYYVQTLASMLPSLILDARPGETVLDIAAAPGSKTTQIAEMMENRGRLTANDYDRGRVQKLIFNLDRMGIVNTAVTSLRGEQFGKLLPNFFDRVLADVPCSSIGTPEKWGNVQNWIKPKKLRTLVTTQASILQSAVKAAKPGGVIVYSTCTLNPMENEAVVDWALKNLDMELETIEENFGLIREEPLTEWRGINFGPEVGKAFKISPVKNPTEGFFIARFRKKGTSKESFKTEPIPNLVPSGKVLEDFFDSYGFSRGDFEKYGFSGNDSKIWIMSSEWAEGVLPFAVRTGLKLAQKRQYGQWRLTPAGAQKFGKFATLRKIELDDAIWRKLMDGKKEPVDYEDGYYLLFGKGRCITYGHVEHGKLYIKIGRPYLLDFDSV